MNEKEDFQTALTTKLALDLETSEASKALQTFPRGPMGLTPDSVKTSPEWKQAKTNYEKVNIKSKAFNGSFLKRWAKEYKAYLLAKRGY